MRSLAGYSVACYVLQIKDRHNGNLLIDESGHLIRKSFYCLKNQATYTHYLILRYRFWIYVI